MTFSVRLATLADIDAMHRVRVAVRENRLSRPDRISQQDYVDSLQSLGRGWVAEADGEVAGFAVGYRSGNIWALFVDPGHEGKGIARALHAEMLAWLRGLGLPNLFLTTGPGTRAEAFYKIAGWTDGGMTADGERRFDYPLRHAKVSASCHCGSVKLHLAHSPDWVLDCNCSLCRRTGALWSYYRLGTVTVDAAPGALSAYVWGDQSLRTMRCSHCGIVTHWEPMDPARVGKWGINTRNLDPAVMQGIRIRRFDGADSWTYFDD
jgi:GNAT superfamily N-acetyltransferase